MGTDKTHNPIVFHNRLAITCQTMRNFSKNSYTNFHFLMIKIIPQKFTCQDGYGVSKHAQTTAMMCSLDWMKTRRSIFVKSFSRKQHELIEKLQSKYLYFVSQIMSGVLYYKQEAHMVQIFRDISYPLLPPIFLHTIFLRNLILLHSVSRF